MKKQVPIIGSLYIESQLYRAWPLFSWQTCTLCDKIFRRQWMWKFRKRRKLYSEKPTYSYCCTDCTSTSYNDAVVALDSYFRQLKFNNAIRGFRDG